MFWLCYAVSGTGCPESAKGTMKSKDYQTAQCHKDLFQSGHPKEYEAKTYLTPPIMGKRKIVKCSEVACHESWSKSNWTSMKRADTCSLEKAPIKSEKSAAVLLIKTRPKYQLRSAEGLLRTTKSTWLQWQSQKSVKGPNNFVHATFSKAMLQNCTFQNKI